MLIIQIPYFHLSAASSVQHAENITFTIYSATRETAGFAQLTPQTRDIRHVTMVVYLSRTVSSTFSWKYRVRDWVHNF